MIKDYDHYAQVMIDDARSMTQLADMFNSSCLNDLSPPEIAFLALTVSSKMRGGWIGESSASPENLYAQLRYWLLNHGMI